MGRNRKFFLAACIGTLVAIGAALALEIINFDPIGNEKHGWMLHQQELLETAYSANCNIAVFRSLEEATSPINQRKQFRMAAAPAKTPGAAAANIRLVQPKIFYFGEPEIYIIRGMEGESTCLSKLVQIGTAGRYVVTVITAK